MLLAEEAESASTAKTKPLEHELLENYFQTTKASKFRTKSGSSWCVELASLPDDCPKDGLDTCSSSKFHVSLWLHLSWLFFRIWLYSCILEALQLPRVPFLCVFLRHWNFAQYWVPPLHTTCSGESSSHNYNDAFTQPGKIPSPMSSPPNWTFQQSRLERFGLMVKGVPLVLALYLTAAYVLLPAEGHWICPLLHNKYWVCNYRQLWTIHHLV